LPRFAKAEQAFAGFLGQSPKSGFERTESPSRLQGRGLLDSKGKAFYGCWAEPNKYIQKEHFRLINLLNENALFKINISLIL